MSRPQSMSYLVTRRRSSLVESEEDLTKAILAPKAPSPIWKRRGSAVSIETIQNNSTGILEATAPFLPTLPQRADNPYNSPTNSDSSETMVLDEELSNCIDKYDFSKTPMARPPTPPDTDNIRKDYGFLNQDPFPSVQEEPMISPGRSAHQRSLSASSIVEPIAFLSNTKSAGSYDFHSEYKERSLQSSRKLHRFFGEKPPLDVCVREIEREGLKAMLQSKLPLCYFLLFLLEEYSSENLFFFLEVEQYEAYDYENSSQQFATAQHIYDTYLTQDSQFEVNIDDKVRKAVVSAIKSQQDARHCFDDAKHAIFLLLEGSFVRFVRSPAADAMRADIGGNTMHYNNRARDNAVALLLRYVDKKLQSGANVVGTLHHSASQKFRNRHHVAPNGHASAPVSAANSATSSPLPSPTSTVSRQRNDLVRSMVHEFIRTLLDVDLDMYMYGPLRHHQNCVPDRVEEISSLPNQQHVDGLDNPTNSLKQASVPAHGIVNRPRKKSIKELKNPFKKNVRRT